MTASGDRRYRAVVESVPLIVWDAAPDGHVHYFNRRWFEYTGLEAGESYGNAWQQAFHPDDLAAATDRWARALEAGEPFEAELRLRGRDGGYRWFLVRGEPLFDDRGVVTRRLGTCTDIEAQRAAEAARLQENEERFRTSVENLLDCFGVYTAVRDGDGHLADFRIEYVNDAACRDNLLARDQQVGRSLLETLPAHRTSGLFEAYARVAETGEPYECEALLYEDARDGRTLSRAYEIRATKLGDGVVAAWRDVTSRKRLEQELKRRVEELAETDRKKDEFLATLAHELRNPLAAIANAAMLARKDGLEAETASWAREVIERQTRQLSGLVDDLLDISRISRGKVQLKPEPLDMAAVVRRAVEGVRSLVEKKRHRLDVRIAAAPMRVEGDPTRLEQVLVNLLTNAAKYTDTGGRIEVEAEVEVKGEGREVVVRVRDTGIGIAPEVLPNVFELFAQFDESEERSQGGLGIGLTLVKRLVELHGGRVTAESEGAGRGSTFTVRLPLQAEPAPGAEAILEGPSDAGPQDGAVPALYRILVVDDNEDTACSMQWLLDASGFETRIARDGPAALTTARAFRPDAILLDIGLPGMSGHEVARTLRTEGFTDVALVALSGYGQPQDHDRSQAAGFDHHLVKPVDFDELLELIGRLQSNRRGRTEQPGPKP